MLILPVKEKGALQCCIAKRSKDGSPSRNRRMPGSRVNWHAPGETNALVKWHLGKRSAWEQAPTLNPQTGLPYSFLEMPRHVHVQLWSEAARCVLPQGRYAALLVSLHGTGLYERYDAANDLPENAQAVQRS